MDRHIYVDREPCKGHIKITVTVTDGAEQAPASWTGKVDRFFPPGEHVQIKNWHGRGLACVVQAHMGKDGEWSELAGIGRWVTEDR